MADSCDIPRAPGDAFAPFPRGGTLRPSGRAADLAPFPASSGVKDAQCRQEGGGKDAGRTRRDLREDGKPWYTTSLEFCRAGDLRREEQRPAGRGRGLIWYGRN